MTVHLEPAACYGKNCEALCPEYLPDEYSTVHFAQNIELSVAKGDFMCMCVCVCKEEVLQHRKGIIVQEGNKIY